MLDEDHYDLEDVKDRILEFLAVQKLKSEVSGPILCFAGPPGVGKTSLGKSIARAMGRKFIRISVGGVRDESEIRGHRRTYVGAMPGTIIRAIRDAGSSNPVFMIDEIDKMGSDWRGDPSSAMLEVLDPEQNGTFRDHYLDLPFDLSRVMFICTANVLDTIPGPLRDRMEIISIAGYTEEDKLHIARRYLVPRQLERNGLKEGQLTVTDAALRAVIENYTREAGVRNLERQIGTIARKFARMVAEEGRKRITVGDKQVATFLGRKKVFRETKRRTSEPGVSTGLAWTPTGGDILFIEARAMPGTGRLILTGQLGDVMKESAQAALTYVRSVSATLGADAEFFQKHDIHVHVPAGAVPKDGPSAGVAMAVCSGQHGVGPSGRLERGHDRRGDPHRAGASGGRHQGEGAGRPGSRDHPCLPAGPQRGRRRGDARRGCPARAAFLLRGARERGPGSDPGRRRRNARPPLRHGRGSRNAAR